MAVASGSSGHSTGPSEVESPVSSPVVVVVVLLVPSVPDVEVASLVVELASSVVELVPVAVVGSTPSVALLSVALLSVELASVALPAVEASVALLAVESSVGAVVSVVSVLVGAGPVAVLLELSVCVPPAEGSSPHPSRTRAQDREKTRGPGMVGRTGSTNPAARHPGSPPRGRRRELAREARTERRRKSVST
ncbi:hypothetical protein [Nannocystis pusilla]|uniref:hypothetical protein n=1 Tax=Nannocystis pusilla TaxID=889268 RepID=UPI003B7D2802